MKVRVITAIVALIIFIPILLLGGNTLLILSLLLGIVGISEFLRMKHRFLFPQKHGLVF